MSQKVIVVHATDDRLFVDQHKLCTYKNTEYLEVSGTHAHLDLSNKVIKEVCKELDLQGSEYNEIIVGTMRDIVVKSIDVQNGLDPRKWII